MKRIVCLTTILLLLFSCEKSIDYNDPMLTEALNASGKNKTELLKVLYSYNKPSDSLKLEAAIFLIKNLKGKMHIEIKEIEKYGKFFDLSKPIWENQSLDLEERKRRFSLLYDSLQIDKTYSNLKSNEDINLIKAEYLIKNINQAFYAWETYPWSKLVPFDDFCNYILPYRVLDESFASWREPLMKRFLWVWDSIKNPQSIKEATILINNAFNNDFTYNSRMVKIPGVLNYDLLDNARMGNCLHLVTMNIYCLRAMGIPARIDYTPQWANHEGKHYWCSIDDENGNLFAFDALYRPKGLSDSSYLVGTFDYIPESDSRTRKTAKILRKTYQNNMDSLPPNLLNKDRVIPKHLIKLNSLDVTSNYKNSSADITLKPLLEKNDEILLLCVFNGTEWVEVDMSFRSLNGSFDFKCVGTGIVYLPIIVNIKNNARKNMTPFVLTDEGRMSNLEPDNTTLRTIKLDRKYFTDHSLTTVLEQTVGGIFQGSNSIDFQHTEDLYSITSLPIPGTNHYHFRSNNFRYVRFIHPTNRCKVAEMSFWGIDNTGFNDSLIKLSGNIISSISKDNNPACKITDGDVLSYFVSQDEMNGWVGIDLGENHSMVSKVEFYPPNDGNSVLIGDKYELFYWDDQWISLGEQIAQEEFLIYENCPEKALFLLRNLSKGSQERIFLYEQDQQIWY